MTWWKRLSGTKDPGHPTDTQDPPLDAAVGAHLRQLHEAHSVAFGGVGFAAKILPETEAYFAMEERVAQYGAALRPHLEALLAKATPAGRIYAAELLTRVDREVGEAAWLRLSGDHEPLDTVSGCLPHRTTVADYAAQRLAGGGPTDQATEAEADDG